ncbi:hypothetical protein PGTUg99_015525 [Puccinia graminis f. sp. tritici]|uniref:Uncharacterized protein n=1 Tax=Puccinia graminis f. sp. tritici TaxID=56615 RepID=A0A5B0S9V3_PUCGR|nr:hypothetical protein PGTUg99_015525 [Puccinia graminis f. sp. tritici]
MAPITRRTASAISENASGDDITARLNVSDGAGDVGHNGGSAASGAESGENHLPQKVVDSLGNGLNDSPAGPPGTSGGDSGGDKVVGQDPNENLVDDTGAKDNAGGNKDTESTGLSSLGDENALDGSGEGLLKTPAPSVTPGLAPPNTPMDLDDGVGAGDQANALKEKEVPKVS